MAADCWTFSSPTGPHGRFIPERPQAEARDDAVSGYDTPPRAGMTDFTIWDDVEPPKGTVFNYPIRPRHKSTAWIAGAPAPRSIAVQIYNRGVMPSMAAKIASGQSTKQAIALAAEELEGFTR